MHLFLWRKSGAVIDDPIYRTVKELHHIEDLQIKSMLHDLKSLLQQYLSLKHLLHQQSGKPGFDSAGYAGGVGSDGEGPVCYYYSPRNTVYEGLGHAEVVHLELSSNAEKEMETFAKTYFSQFQKTR